MKGVSIKSEHYLRLGVSYLKTGFISPIPVGEQDSGHLGDRNSRSETTTTIYMVADVIFSGGRDCNLFDGPRKETDYFKELFFDEEFENEICCVN